VWGGQVLQFYSFTALRFYSTLAARPRGEREPIREQGQCRGGVRVKSPDYSRLDKRLRRKQKQLARQVKGSKRREKTRLHIAKLHHKIADTRKHFLHKLSTRVVYENQVITLEDLNVSGMVKNRNLARVISQQGWREFRGLCEAKSEKLGRQFNVISRWEPTSQICSDCGYR
jgi:putative transposase